jgi:hypothetical protein
MASLDCISYPAQALRPTAAPAAVRLGEYLQRTADRAGGLAGDVVDRLGPISQSMNPSEACCAPSEDWPSLFRGYAGDIQRIDLALDAIQDALRRLEL